MPRCKIAHMSTDPSLMPTFVPPSQAFTPVPAPPYPMGPEARALGDLDSVQSLEGLNAATPTQLACWSMYLCLRRWLFDGVPVLTIGDQPEKHHAKIRSFYLAMTQESMGASTAIGVMLDRPNMRKTLAPFEDVLDRSREAITQLAYQTAKTRGYPRPRLLLDATQWPSLEALDEMEMVCVEWLAKQTSEHQSVFKMLDKLRAIVPGLARREAVCLINTWRRVMMAAMKRSREEVLAESELQTLEAAGHREATPALKLAATRSLASLHGLGKEERSQDLQQTLLELLAKPLKALPKPEEEDE